MDNPGRSNMINHIQMKLLEKPAPTACSNGSCPKIGCDKHYMPIQKCLLPERTGIIKDTNNQKKQYQCEMCSKSFAQSISLKRHVRTHTGEKPFGCKVCGRRFTNSSHLTTHMRTHTGERPFQCDMCDKKFSQHSGLHVHIRTHTGDKPYKCEICGKGFLDRSALKRHGSTHMNNRNKTRKAVTSSRKSRRVELQETVKSNDELDNAAALICVKTLQEYLTTLGISLSLQGDTMLSLQLNNLLMHMLTSVMSEPDIKHEHASPDVMTSNVLNSHHDVIRSPVRGHFIMTPCPRTPPASLAHIQNFMPTPISTPSPCYYPVQMQATSPTRPTVFPVFSHTSATPHSPITPHSLITPLSPISPPHITPPHTKTPFICTVSSVTSFSNIKTEPDRNMN